MSFAILLATQMQVWVVDLCVAGFMSLQPVQLHRALGWEGTRALLLPPWNLEFEQRTQHFYFELAVVPTTENRNSPIVVCR